MCGFNAIDKGDADQLAVWNDWDPLAELLDNLPRPRGPEVSVFEVGCWQGLCSARLNSSKGWPLAGLDPSGEAIAEAASSGCGGMVGTKEALSLSDRSVGLLIYGFALCLQIYLMLAFADDPQQWAASFNSADKN